MMQKTDFILSDAVIEDAFMISLIEKECFSSPWSLEQIEDEIHKDNVIFLVARQGSELVGYISGQLILDEFYISNVAVEKNYRKQGIGFALIDRLIKILYTRVCSFATLEVRESNFDARKLYEKFGFVNLGIRRNFYSHPKENACIYTLYFNSESEEKET